MPCNCIQCVRFRANMATEPRVEPEPPPEVEEEEELDYCEWHDEDRPDVEQYGWASLCADCRNHATLCDSCDRAVPSVEISREYLTDTGRWVELCSNCLEECRWCVSCDELYSPNADFYDGECPACQENHGGIESWNYRPSVRLIDARGALQVATYYMGIELETDHISRRDVAESVANLTDNLYCKEDGSLNDGVEIVSHPGSLEAWQNGDVIPWGRWESECTPNFMDMGEVETAGIHVHVSRTAFEKNGRWSAAHLWKFMQLHYRNEKAFQYLAGRDGSSYAGWDAINDRKDVTPKAKARHGYSSDRYRVLNVNNEATVECRYFQADERKEVILSHIELVHASVEYTRNLQSKAVRLGLLDFKYFRAWYMQRREIYPNLTARTREFPQIVKRNRKRNEILNSAIEDEKRQHRERMERLAWMYTAMHIPPPTTSTDNMAYPGLAFGTPSELRWSLQTQEVRTWWYRCADWADGDTRRAIRWAVNDLLSNYLFENAGIDAYEYRYAARRAELRTAASWHAWDIFEAIRETTDLIPDGTDLSIYHGVINDAVARMAGR